MTRRTNARIAGITFLAYIAVGIAAMTLSGRALHGPDVAAKLLNLARHEGDVRLAATLNLASGFAALVLAVTLYALTRDQDRDLALLALACRFAEGVVGGIAIQRSLGLLWLAGAAGTDAAARASSSAMAAFLLGQGWSFVIGATFFAVGSTLFSWLMLRGRVIPAGLAWLGVVASVLLAVGLPLQLAGALDGGVVQWLWIPMAAFEIVLALWLIFKGAAEPAGARVPRAAPGSREARP